ncbi:Shikimate O-hydroxycinnamoyl transferase [Quillaja saponaria]|uniref:Shikimate O-hydroxycinnamoyl transferase n=1 Tax=Quillaja saponaria TaxID=32244 RepID=A0AAD7PBH0_QUISA|nr:Shikimate O-hydroxycinnamoyl transferase [Quillaja saponaria]
MVSITTSCTVIPSEPTPNGLMGLSHFDQIQGMKHAPSNLFFYKQDHNSSTIADVTKRLKDSLSKILVPYYPLAGRLCRIQGRVELECNAKGVQFVEAICDDQGKVVDDYIDFEPTEAVNDFIPTIDYNTIPLEEWPLLLVQLTRLSCGGLCVGIAVSHTVCDGWSQFRFINSWTKLAKEEGNWDVNNETMQPLHNRTLLKSMGHCPPRFDHREFKAPPALLGCSDTKTEQDKPISVAVLRVSRDQIENLKKEAQTESTYEAIAAHMWRCACKARKGDTNQPTSILSVADIRNRFKPRIPPSYFGNAILPTLTPICLFGEILSNPLSYTAQKISESIQNLTDDYIKSTIDFVKIHQQCVDSLRIGSPTGHYHGNPNLNIGCLISLPAYDADFGWGKPVYFGVGSFISVDGRSFIMPGPAADGSIVINLRLQTQHMEAFKKFFYEDIGQFCKARL